MFTSDSIWGIDLGDSCIKAVKMSVKKDELKVLDYAYFELDADKKKKEGYLAVLTEALEDLVAQKEFKGSEVSLSMSSKSVNSRFLSIDGGLSPKELNAEILAEAERQIPFPLEEVEWGSVVMPSTDAETQVAIFAVRSEHIQELLDIADDIGLQVRGIQVSGVALHNFISSVAGVDEHTVILDFGEKSTDLLLVHDGQFWLRSLPLSGHHITELLEKKFRITTKEASALKHEMEKSPQKDKLFRVIEPKLKELVTEIKRSINFRRTQVKGLDPKQILACGGSSQLPGVSEYFTKELKQTQFELKLDEIDFSDCDDADGLKENIVSYGVAMGMAIQGLGETDVELNLIPKKYAFLKIIKTKRLAAVLCNIALILIVVMTYIADSDYKEILDKTKSKTQRALGNLNAAISNFEEKQDKLKPIESRVEYAMRVSKKEQFLPRVYSEVVKMVQKAENVYLTSLRIDPIHPSKYMEERSEGAKVLRGGIVYLEYIGKSPQDNLNLYGILLDHPLFKLVEGEADPTPTGEPRKYQWTYNPQIDLSKDRFLGNETVAKMREERGWVYNSVGDPVEKVYQYHIQSLELHFDIDSFWSNQGGQQN